MAATNYVDQLMELEAQEQSIKEQKQKILAQAKSQALATAEKAVSDLNSLGFHYKLTESGPTTRATSTAATRSPRKGGVSEQVLAAVKASPTGLARAGVLAALSASDTKAEQSISNALSNLKKKGQLTAKDGVYMAA